MSIYTHTQDSEPYMISFSDIHANTNRSAHTSTTDAEV